VVLHPFQVLRQQRRVPVHDIRGDVIQRPGLEPAHPEVALEVGDGQPVLDEPLAAACLETRLDLLQEARNGIRRQRLASLLPGLAVERDRIADPGRDVLDCIHHLVRKCRRHVVPWVEIREPADITVDRVGLGDCPAVDFQHGHGLERSRVAQRRPVLACDPLVHEGDAAKVHGQARGFTAAAVEIEVGQDELGHGDSGCDTRRDDTGRIL